MKFSEIAVKPVQSQFFQEIGYVIHRKDLMECAVVDPGLEPEHFLDFLQSEKLTPVALLITHGHGDHIGGIPALKANWPAAKIYIGEQDGEKLIDPEKNLSASIGASFTVSGADVLLRDQDKIEIAGLTIEVRHVPGHSRGHVVYWIPAEPKGIVFVGDVIFQGSVGRSDFPDGDPAIQIPMIQSQILTLPDETIIYPGHGMPTTIGAERYSNPFL